MKRFHPLFFLLFFSDGNGAKKQFRKFTHRMDDSDYPSDEYEYEYEGESASSDASDASESPESPESDESGSEERDDAPGWLYEVWELMDEYEAMGREIERAERRVELTRARNLAVRYVQRVAAREARALRALLHSPPHWTERFGEEYVEKARRAYAWLDFLRGSVSEAPPHGRRDHISMDADDRETVLRKIDDPEVRRVVAALTSKTTKTGVGLRAALAVGKLKARVNRNAGDNWHPDGARGRALVEKYRNDAWPPSELFRSPARRASPARRSRSAP